jgi:GNAT superfamily N-acetyltransferase
MDGIVIRKITGSEVESAMALALEVFMQFEAPDYHPSGVETFKRDIVENPEYLEMARQGVCPIYGAFDGDKIVALMGMRSNKTHINLVFTKKEYHRRGIARAIFRCLLQDVLEENPTLQALTLNSSPYGLPFYLAIGFVPLSEEQEINGIRFTPMKYIVNRNAHQDELRSSRMEHKVELLRAEEKDGEMIRSMQQEAFGALLEKYRDYDMSPATESLERIRWKISQPDSFYYLILVAGQIVGGIRVVDAGNGSAKRISPLYILPSYRGKGYAQAAMVEAERIHGADRWHLDTILQEKGNCCLYEKMGYRQTGRQTVIHDGMTIVDYEKG